MNWFQKAVSAWGGDHGLRRIVRNSSYLFVGNTLSTVVQSILSARLLGILGFGILGVVVEFSTNVNRLLSFRMGELVVRYVGKYLAEGRKDKAAAVFKAAILLESASSILAYLLLLLLAPLAAGVILKDVSLGALITFYAIAMLANFATEAAIGLLQVADAFKTQAVIGFIQSLLTAGLIVYAFVTGGDIWMVLGAYLAGKVFNGLALAVTASWKARTLMGAGWWRVSFAHLPPKREFWQFAWSTNFSGTVTMVTRDSESILLASLLSPLAAGYYKTAKAVINLVTLPITPFITAAYPAINRAVVEKGWNKLADLLKKLTILSGAWTGLVTVGLLVFGQWLITTFYGSDFAPAYGATLILLLGYGIANIFYWNRNLLLALGDPKYPLQVITFVGAAKLVLTVLLVPMFGFLMEAALMSAFFIVSIGLIVLRGVKQVRANQRQEGKADGARGEPIKVAQAGLPGLSVEDERVLRKHKARGVFPWRDWLVGLAFLGFTGLFFLGRLQGNYPVVLLTGDGGNIASYAAAADHPDWFADDPALGDENNIGIYQTIHIPLIRGLARLTGDYGQAYAWLVLPQTFLQLFGFYLLGKRLFKDRFWAFLLALICAATVDNLGLGEVWGLWQDALPRFTFQAALPYLLVLFLTWKERPGRWPWVMVLAGLMVYLHPISAPAWGLAIWGGMWLFLPAGWNWKKRLLVMVGLGFVFLAALAPFTLNYLAYRGRDPVGDYGTIMPILEAFSPAHLFDIPAAVGTFAFEMTKSLLIPLGLIGFAFTWRLKKGDRREVVLVLVWMAGMIVTSILIPFAERAMEAHYRFLPLESELVRCMRYLVPLMLIFWLWPLAEWTARKRRPGLRRGAALVGMALVAFWVGGNRPAVGDMLSAGSCLLQGRLLCAETRPIHELIVTLREQTLPGEGVFFYNSDLGDTSRSLSVRYAAQRPLVYSYRDSGILGYSNRGALPAWLEITQRVEAIRGMADPEERLGALIGLAESLSAVTLIVDFEVPAEALRHWPVRLLMVNSDYTLLALDGGVATLPLEVEDGQ